MFCKERQKHTKAELGGPRVEATEVTKRLAHEWKSLEAEDKAVYDSKYKQICEDYEQAVQGWLQGSCGRERSPLQTTTPRSAQGTGSPAPSSKASLRREAQSGILAARIPRDFQAQLGDLFKDGDALELESLA